MKKAMKLFLGALICGIATVGLAEDKLTTYTVGMKGVT